ncbi:radical SAM protein [bacterium]|nr:radical SAM protein [bacterium]
MWEKVSKLKSRYPDNFDYGMYDRLHERFGLQQPRGGVVFKGSLKLLESKDCDKCFYRFEVDTYGRGCIHNCAYCYAKAYLHQRKYWNEPMPFPIDISEIRKTFATVFESDRHHKLRSVLEQRIPLRIGSMSDSFMWMDKKYKVTLELLKILKFYDYPYIVFTRSDLIAEDEYAAQLDPMLASIQMSISSINEELTKKIEPGAPSPARRLRALEKLAKSGFYTTVRINPLFPIYPDGYYTDPNFDRSKKIDPFPFFSWDMIPAIAQHKVDTVLVGVVRLYMHNLRFLSQALGFNFKDRFSGSTRMERAALHYSESETAFYYTKARDLCKQQGLRFSTCYIGNDTSGESFYKYQSLWSNKDDCCDALGNVRGFTRTCANLSKPSPRVPTDFVFPNTTIPSVNERSLV